MSVQQQSIRDEWIARLATLIDRLEGWAREDGWATRQIETTVRDHEIGDHDAPALLLQKEWVQIAVQPYGRRGVRSEVEGIVDVYLMPQFIDMAVIFGQEGRWRLAYAFRKPRAPDDDGDPRELTRETFVALLTDLQNGGTR